MHNQNKSLNATQDETTSRTILLIKGTILAMIAILISLPEAIQIGLPECPGYLCYARDAGRLLIIFSLFTLILFLFTGIKSSKPKTIGQLFKLQKLISVVLIATILLFSGQGPITRSVEKWLGSTLLGCKLSYTADTCILFLAKDTNNPELCHEIPIRKYNFRRDDCFEHFADKKNKVSRLSQ